MLASLIGALISGEAAEAARRARSAAVAYLFAAAFFLCGAGFLVVAGYIATARELGAVTAVEHHCGAGRGQPLRQALADPLARAGDQRPPAGKVEQLQ